MMNRKFLAGVVLALAMQSGWSPAAAAVEEPTAEVALSGIVQARQYVKFIGNKALAIARDTSLSQEDKKQQIGDLFDVSLDIEKLSRLVLGRYWRAANDNQREQYIHLYREYLLKYYAAKFINYTGDGFDITKVFDEGDGRFRVNTVIAQSETTPEVRVNYRLKKDMSTGSFLIYDIIVEGVSLLTTQRSEFGAVVSRNGMDFLLEQLQERIRKLDAGEPADAA